MTHLRELATVAPPAEVPLRGPPNWTAVIFFATLSGLHLAIAIPAFAHGRWEGYLSLIFAGGFLSVCLICYLARSEMIVQPAQRRIRLRSGFGPFRFERTIPFGNVHAVRVTLSDNGRPADSRVEVLCDNEDLECPASSIPRQEALFLAMVMDVRLIKVCNDCLPPGRDRLLDPRDTSQP
jgi:hypothetical protein